MKNRSRLFLITILIVVLSITTYYFIFWIHKSSTSKTLDLQNQSITQNHPELPMRLSIPVINVETNIQRVGVDTNGDMQAPSNTVDVGWFDLGPRPGERGSAVIGGHFNGENGELGVFANLDQLKTGDKLYTTDAAGTKLVFIVRTTSTYNPGYAEEVFSLSDSAHLNLITCDGVWDEVNKTYSKRLVVFADILN